MTASVSGVVLEGIAAAVPANVVDNAVVGREVFGADLEKVMIATGVRTRRVCRKPETTAVDLAVRASQALFEAMKLDPASLGAVIFVTFTPEYVMPFNAAACQSRLGLPKGIAAFDVNLACSGYPTGLYLAATLARSLGKRVLLLDGDKQSHLTSPRDRATCLLFADAGTATVVAPAPGAPAWHFEFFSDGDGAGALRIPHGGSKHPFSAASLEVERLPDGSERRPVDIHMEGLEVFKFVVNTMPAVVRALFAGSGANIEEIDAGVFHQANKYMVMQAAKALKLPKEKVPLTIEKFGNVSSASVPLTIVSELKQAVESGRRRLLLSGFGAGLAVAAALIEMGPCVVPEVVFHDG